MRSVAVAALLTLLLLAETWQDEAGRLFKERKFSAAAAILEKRLKSDPRDFGALMLLGICQQQSGELSKAEASFLTATKLQPGKLHRSVLSCPRAVLSGTVRTRPRSHQ